MSLLKITESERLILREVGEDDFSCLLNMFRNPAVMRFFDGLRDEAQTRSWIEANTGNYKKHGFGKWIITRKEDGKTLGHSGFYPTLIDGVVEMELGYFLDQPYWHKGYATEAAQAALILGFGKLGFSRIVSAINPKNEPSVSVALRLGMKREKFAIAKAGEISWEADIYARAAQL